MRVVPFSASGNTFDPGVDLIATSTDAGATWHQAPAPGRREWDPMDAEKGFPRWVEPLAWDAQGALYSLWSNREGVWLARSSDHGTTWSSGELVKGGDLAYFPYLVARGDGSLAATWFSGMGETMRAHVVTIDAAHGRPRVTGEATFVPDTWTRQDPRQRETAGEYLALAFLDEGKLGDRRAHPGSPGRTPGVRLLDGGVRRDALRRLQPKRIVSIDTDPPSTPSTGNDTGSPGRDAPSTYTSGR